MKYLTEKDRYLIEKLHQEKTPVAKIAEMIGCCRATVYNEIKRGTFIARGKLWQDEKRYGYDVGQRIHKENMSRRGRKRKLSADDPFLSDVAALILNKKYSPEAALYALPDHKLCVKSIYNYVYAHRIKGVTVNNLPYAKPRKKKKNEEETTKKEFSRGRSIEERPREILERKEYGHWEMDTVYSSRDDLTCLLVLSERKSRDELIFKIKDRTAKSVIRTLDQYERKIGSPAFRGKFRQLPATMEWNSQIGSLSKEAAELRRTVQQSTSAIRTALGNVERMKTVTVLSDGGFQKVMILVCIQKQRYKLSRIG